MPTDSNSTSFSSWASLIMSICSNNSRSNALTSFILPISEPCSRLILPACTGSSQISGLFSCIDNKSNLTTNFFHCHHHDKKYTSHCHILYKNKKSKLVSTLIIRNVKQNCTSEFRLNWKPANTNTHIW